MTYKQRLPDFCFDIIPPVLSLEVLLRAQCPCFLQAFNYFPHLPYWFCDMGVILYVLLSHSLITCYQMLVTNMFEILSLAVLK